MSPRKTGKKKPGASRKRPGSNASARRTAGRKAPAPASPRPEADDQPAPPRAPGFPIVGVGGSAGALPALRDLLVHMPPNCGLAFVVIVHTDPHGPSMLVELLSRHTRMPVLEAASGQRVEPCRVYVAPSTDGAVRALESAGFHMTRDTARLGSAHVSLVLGVKSAP